MLTKAAQKPIRKPGKHTHNWYAQLIVPRRRVSRKQPTYPNRKLRVAVHPITSPGTHNSVQDLHTKRLKRHRTDRESLT